MKPTALPKKDSASFLKRLKQLKKDLKIETTAELGRYLGTSPRTIASWLSGQNNVTAEGVHKIETALEAKIEEFDRQADPIAAFLLG